MRNDGFFRFDGYGEMVQHWDTIQQAPKPSAHGIQSFVTDNKVYCVYVAPDEATVRQHAQKGGFPANSIARVVSVIDPTTAE